MKHRLVAVIRRKHDLWMAVAAALFAATAAAVPARLDVPAGMTLGGGRPARTATLKHDPQFILDAVARRMKITLRPEIPLPAIRLESNTQLRHMQAAAERQWGFRPLAFLSTYAAASNEIYLIDRVDLYEIFPRTLDDTLAHELVHYLQATYRRDRSDTDWSEFEAVSVQTWFRNEYMTLRRVATDKRQTAGYSK